MEALLGFKSVLVHHLLLLIGIITMTAFYFGRAARQIRLPSIIGFIILGVLLGPSCLNLVSADIRSHLSFITEMALGFVAVSIGLELNFRELKKFGASIIAIIIAESFGAFLVVLAGVYLLTGNLPMALIFAAIAPASAPAGTVAIIREYRARGSLTRALYAVVGFDDGLGVIIFGFSAAVARNLLISDAGGEPPGFWVSMAVPLKEIVFSILIGGGGAFVFALLGRRRDDPADVAVLLFGFILVLSGLSAWLHLSLILTNMTAGMYIANSRHAGLAGHVRKRLPDLLPVLFILFFTLAGANLHIGALPALGGLGVLYIICRAAGLVGGSLLGGFLGGAEEKIRKFVGMGILSQAGLAIGLALMVKQDFTGLGKTIILQGKEMTAGGYIGSVVITTITASCIIFEIVGPVLTKIALTRAGEIDGNG